MVVIYQERRFHQLLWDTKVRNSGNNKGVISGELFIIIGLFDKITKT